MRAHRQLFTLLRDRRDCGAGRSALEELQRIRLTRLLTHAFQSVPFWRHRLTLAGIRPEDVRSPRDLSCVPILTRDEVQCTPVGELLSSAADRSQLRRITTSGSSGRPLAVYFSPDDATRINLSWLRPIRAHGIAPWHKRFEITGAHNIPTHTTGWQKMGLWRREVVSILVQPAEWAERLRHSGARYLWGYGSAIKTLARYMVEAGVRSPPLRAVFAVSDVTDSSGRALVRQQFGREIVDMYGATEAGCIAWQCPARDGYHVNADNLVVEVLADGRPAAPGELGTVVVTNLFSSAMPLIRYELGDLVASGVPRCTCGSSLPLLARIEGREDAALVLPSGRTLPPMFFDNVLKHFLEIRAWRAVQDDTLDVDLSVVRGPEYSPQVEETLRDQIATFLPEPLAIRIRHVEQITPDAAGKRRAVQTLARKT